MNVEDLKRQMQTAEIVGRLCNQVRAFKETLPAIVYALHYLDFGWPDNTLSFERCMKIWKKTIEPALKQEHFGDCNKEPQACLRCQAKQTMYLAGKIEEGLRDEH